MRSRILTIFFIAVVLNGCGLFAYERLAAYDLTVQVRDSSGAPVSGATIKSTDNQKVKTSRKGEARLVYTTGGLHVITVSARNSSTQQIKVTVPMVEQNRITVYLDNTRMAEPEQPLLQEQFVEQ